VNKSMEKNIQELFEAAKEIQSRAYAPYSKFKVGAAFRLKTGEIVSGHNVENASYGATVCAERVGLFNALSLHNSQDFESLLIVTDTETGDLPCALCLQVLSEFVSPDLPVYSANKEEVKRSFIFKELLPYPFDKFNLDESQS